jgi:hypothetical protein
MRKKSHCWYSTHQEVHKFQGGIIMKNMFEYVKENNIDIYHAAIVEYVIEKINQYSKTVCYTNAEVYKIALVKLFDKNNHFYTKDIIENAVRDMASFDIFGFKTKYELNAETLNAWYEELASITCKHIEYYFNEEYSK